MWVLPNSMLSSRTLISDVERPAAVLAEVARVAKPGGSIGIFDATLRRSRSATRTPIRANVTTKL